MKNIELRRKARLLVFIVTLMAATFCDFVSANDFVANQIIVRVDDVLTLQDAASVVDNGDFTVIRELDGELGYFLQLILKTSEQDFDACEVKEA